MISYARRDGFTDTSSLAHGPWCPMQTAKLSGAALRKATSFELTQQLAHYLAQDYPELLPHLSPIIKRLKPVRLEGRFLRAWGRDVSFNSSQRPVIRRLVKAHENKTPSVPLTKSEQDLLDPLRACDLIQHDGDDGFRLQPPPDEVSKPRLVSIYSESNPKAEIDNECLALAVLFQHPEWSNEQIAATVGVHPGTVSRYPRLKAARGAQELEKQRFAGRRDV